MLTGIAINRLGISVNDFYRLSPLELYYALKDHENTYFGWVKLIANVIRMVGMTVYNSAFGRQKKDAITDPVKYIQFGWDKPNIQTVDEMKQTIMGLTHFANVKVKQGDEVVQFTEDT